VVTEGELHNALSVLDDQAFVDIVDSLRYISKASHQYMVCGIYGGMEVGDSAFWH